MVKSVVCRCLSRLSPNLDRARIAYPDLCVIDQRLRYCSFPLRALYSVYILCLTSLPSRMSDDAEKLLAKLDLLNDSLDVLEEKLEPLLSQTLPETLLPLETIQQVKLNVAIPYLVYDLVFS